MFLDGTLLGSGKPPVSLEDFLEGLEARLAEKEEAQNSRKADLGRTDGQLAENTELIHKVSFFDNFVTFLTCSVGTWDATAGAEVQDVPGRAAVHPGLAGLSERENPTNQRT